MEKLHYYSMSFWGSSLDDSTPNTLGSVYFGYSDKKITKRKIDDAKQGAKVSQDSVLLSCCYLGFMTPDEFKNV